ncbi:MAG TPA: hypothetical protein VFV65_02110, partial [Gemmatimonadales bacterium]|nr:hypothetical protein [Gemmatimonadales bacterium]
MPRRPIARPTLLAVLPAVLGAATLAAQQPKVPVQTLTNPEAAYDEPFTQLVGVRELRNGDVIVADMRDRSLLKVDLKTGTAAKLSREGSGPTEFLFPTAIYPFPGDST